MVPLLPTFWSQKFHVKAFSRVSCSVVHTVSVWNGGHTLFVSDTDFHCVHRVLLDVRENEYGAVQERKQLLSRLRDHYGASESTPPAEDDEDSREEAENGGGIDGIEDHPEELPVLSVEEILEQFEARYNDQISASPPDTKGVNAAEKVCTLHRVPQAIW